MLQSYYFVRPDQTADVAGLSKEDLKKFQGAFMDPFESEEKIEQLVAPSSYASKEIDCFIEKNIAHARSTADTASEKAWVQRKVEREVMGKEDSVNAKFFAEFVAFLCGKTPLGTAEYKLIQETNNTVPYPQDARGVIQHGWKIDQQPPVRRTDQFGDEIRAYIQTYLDRHHRMISKAVQLKIEGPRSLGEHWLFWKYIIKGHIKEYGTRPLPELFYDTFDWTDPGNETYGPFSGTFAGAPAGFDGYGAYINRWTPTKQTSNRFDEDGDPIEVADGLDEIRTDVAAEGGCADTFHRLFMNGGDVARFNDQRVAVRAGRFTRDESDRILTTIRHLENYIAGRPRVAPWIDDPNDPDEHYDPLAHVPLGPPGALGAAAGPGPAGPPGPPGPPGAGRTAEELEEERQRHEAMLKALNDQGLANVAAITALKEDPIVVAERYQKILDAARAGMLAQKEELVKSLREIVTLNNEILHNLGLHGPPHPPGPPGSAASSFVSPDLSSYFPTVFDKKTGKQTTLIEQIMLMREESRTASKDLMDRIDGLGPGTSEEKINLVITQSETRVDKMNEKYVEMLDRVERGSAANVKLVIDTLSAMLGTLTTNPDETTKINTILNALIHKAKTGQLRDLTINADQLGDFAINLQTRIIDYMEVTLANFMTGIGTHFNQVSYGNSVMIYQSLTNFLQSLMTHMEGAEGAKVETLLATLKKHQRKLKSQLGSLKEDNQFALNHIWQGLKANNSALTDVQKMAASSNDKSMFIINALSQMQVGLDSINIKSDYSLGFLTAIRTEFREVTAYTFQQLVGRITELKTEQHANLITDITNWIAQQLGSMAPELREAVEVEERGQKEIPEIPLLDYIAPDDAGKTKREGVEHDIEEEDLMDAEDEAAFANAGAESLFKLPAIASVVPRHNPRSKIYQKYGYSKEVADYIKAQWEVLDPNSEHWSREIMRMNDLTQFSMKELGLFSHIISSAQPAQEWFSFLQKIQDMDDPEKAEYRGLEEILVKYKEAILQLSDEHNLKNFYDTGKLILPFWQDDNMYHLAMADRIFLFEKKDVNFNTIAGKNPNWHRYRPIWAENCWIVSMRSHIWFSGIKSNPAYIGTVMGQGVMAVNQVHARIVAEPENYAIRSYLTTNVGRQYPKNTGVTSGGEQSDADFWREAVFEGFYYTVIRSEKNTPDENLYYKNQPPHPIDPVQAILYYKSLDFLDYNGDNIWGSPAYKQVKTGWEKKFITGVALNWNNKGNWQRALMTIVKEGWDHLQHAQTEWEAAHPGDNPERWAKEEISPMFINMFYLSRLLLEYGQKLTPAPKWFRDLYRLYFLTTGSVFKMWEKEVPGMPTFVRWWRDSTLKPYFDPLGKQSQKYFFKNPHKGSKALSKWHHNTKQAIRQNNEEFASWDAYAEKHPAAIPQFPAIYNAKNPFFYHTSK